MSVSSSALYTIKMQDHIFYDLSVSLNVDAAVRSLIHKKALLERWQGDEDRIIRFGRAAVRSATYMGLSAAERFERPRHHKDWQESERLAQAALNALRELLEHMAGGKEPLQKYGNEVLTPLMYRVTMKALKPEDLEGPNRLRPDKIARERANTLLQSKEIIESYAMHAIDRVDHVAGLGLQNPGDPVLRAFVFAMAEAWLALTGRVPGKSARISQNVFLQFALAAWKDAGGDVQDDSETFAQQALRAAIPEIERRKAEGRLRPSWA